MLIILIVLFNGLLLCYTGVSIGGEDMLKFILGKSGSGKTRKAFDIIQELYSQGESRLMMLVPDQSSFETEKTLFRLLGAKECRDVLVFGFNRLCDYVFKNTGNIPQNVIDDGVRRILMSKAIDAVTDKLSVFSGKTKRRSVLDLMLHSLKECRKDHISPEMLLSASENVESDILKSKLCETALALDAYDAMLSDSYIDPIENLDRLASILSDNRMFEGYTIVLDSFSGFTYQQLSVLEILMKDSLDFYVTLNLDVEYRELELFETTNRTYKLLKRIAKQNSVKVGEELILREFHRSDKDDISFLEKYIFRNQNEAFQSKAENIHTFIGSNIYREVHFVAQRIMRLVYENGYSYSDISIIGRSMEKYNGILDTVLDNFDIPFYMDMPRDIFTMPFVRFVSSAIDCALLGFERESVLSMLKSGLTHFSETEISEFENYLFVWNLDRSGLKKEFVNNPSGFEKMTESDEKALQRIKSMRQRIIEPLVNFSEACKEATGLEISKALYKLITDFDIESAIDSYYDKLTSQGLVFEANDAVRTYNSVSEVLDKLVSVVGEETITLKKYKEYLDFLIADIKLSDIPRYQDQVNIASADRVRLQNEKVVFIVGANDGEFPSVPKTAGAFSENERRILIENSIPLTDSLEQLASHEKYLAYCALSAASEKLFVSSYIGDYSGESYHPSVIYGEIEELFPRRNHSTSSDSYELYNRQQAFEYLAENYDSDSAEVNTLLSYFENDDYYAPFAEKLRQAVDKLPFRINNREAAEKLFKKHMNISASQIETYNKCAFRYFCNYGLRAKERKKASIDSMQFGNVVHYFLEQFLKAFDKQTLNTLGDKEIKSSIDMILTDYADENFGGLNDKPESFLNLFERLKENIFALIKHIIRQLGYSDFIPCDFELHIGGEVEPYKVELDDEHSVSVTGYIDRVDKFEKNDETYIRVVDYKTGNKDFKLYEILYGINLQMLIYLRALEKGGNSYYKTDIIPTGVLYMPSTLEPINAEKYKTEEKIKSKLDDNFRMNGLVLSDGEVLQHMDRAGRFIRFSKSMEDGRYSNSVASGEQFKMIFEHIDKVIREMGENLQQGFINAEPIKGAVDGCAFCPYDSVCLHTYEDDYRFRKIANPKEVYTTLERESEGDDERTMD